MRKNEPTSADVRVKFKRSDNQSGLKGREADYLMITFSSIKASVRVEKVFTSEMITRSFYMEIVII